MTTIIHFYLWRFVPTHCEIQKTRTKPALKCVALKILFSKLLDSDPYKKFVHCLQITFLEMRENETIYKTSIDRSEMTTTNLKSIFKIHTRISGNSKTLFPYSNIRSSNRSQEIESWIALHRAIEDGNLFVFYFAIAISNSVS